MTGCEADPYPIIEVPADALRKDEQMGSKGKFWYKDKDNDLGWCLFKQGRTGTAEDFAEKAAAELAAMLGLPHARVEFAQSGDRFGTISVCCLRDGEFLRHGNDLLLQIVEDYPRQDPTHRFARVSQHTVSAVRDAMTSVFLELPVGWQTVRGIDSAVGVFIGYLLFDAWIGNTDRHHENWAWVVSAPPWPQSWTCHLCPTFDHASSLGRELQDSRRKQLLDNRGVDAYAAKGRSALFGHQNDPVPLGTLEAFNAMASEHAKAAKMWVDKLLALDQAEVAATLRRVPSQFASNLTIEFAIEILSANRRRIEHLRKEFGND